MDPVDTRYDLEAELNAVHAEVDRLRKRLAETERNLRGVSEFAKEIMDWWAQQPASEAHATPPLGLFTKVEGLRQRIAELEPYRLACRKIHQWIGCEDQDVDEAVVRRVEGDARKIAELERLAHWAQFACMDCNTVNEHGAEFCVACGSAKMFPKVRVANEQLVRKLAALESREAELVDALKAAAPFVSTIYWNECEDFDATCDSCLAARARKKVEEALAKPRKEVGDE